MATNTSTGTRSKAKAGAKKDGPGGLEQGSVAREEKAGGMKTSRSGGGESGLAKRFTPASLRRLLESGVRVIEGKMGFYQHHEPFSAISLAAYFTMTARQSWSALDRLADEGLVRWIETENGYDERWQVTRNGLYVVQSYIASKNRVQSKAAAALSVRMSALLHLPSKFEALDGVIGWGPWMNGSEYGPVIIGLEVSDWTGIDAKTRFEMIIAALDGLALEEHMDRRHVPNVVVMGFSAKDGVPWRLRRHKVLGLRKSADAGRAEHGIGELVELDGAQLDVDEAKYQEGVEDLAEKLGLWVRPAEDEDDERRHSRGREADHLSWYDMVRTGFNPFDPDQAKPTEEELSERRRVWGAKAAVTMEVAAVRLSPCGSLRPRRGHKKPSEAPARNRGLLGFAWSEDRDYWRNVDSLRWHLGTREYAPKDLGAHADAMHEAGVTESAVRSYAWLANAERSGRDVVQAFEVLRRGWLTHIGAMQKHDEAVLKRQTRPKVAYFTLFCIGAGEPVPVAMVRQPISQNKAMRDAVSLALMGALRRLFTRYGEPMAKYLGEERGLWSLSWLMCGKRVSTDRERAAYEAATKAAGQTIQFIRINQDRKAIGRFRGMVNEGPVVGFGIESFDPPGDMAINLDWYGEAKKALEVAKRAVGEEFFDDYDSWWIDARKAPLGWVLGELAGEDSVIGRRLRCAIWEPMSGREEPWIQDADRTPTVRALEGGEFEVEVRFTVGSIKWRMKTSDGGRGSSGGGRSQDFGMGYIELSYLDRSWRLPVVAEYERDRDVTLATCLEILNGLNMFNNEDPVATAKEVVPASMWGVKAYRRLVQAEADVRASDLMAKGHSRAEAYEALRIGGEPLQVTLTDEQWLAGMVDSVLSRRNHNSDRWKQGMMDTVMGTVTSDEEGW